MQKQLSSKDPQQAFNFSNRKRIKGTLSHQSIFVFTGTCSRRFCSLASRLLRRSSTIPDSCSRDRLQSNQPIIQGLRYFFSSKLRLKRTFHIWVPVMFFLTDLMSKRRGVVISWWNLILQQVSEWVSKLASVIKNVKLLMGVVINWFETWYFNK
jgi:hypothetical protein